MNLPALLIDSDWLWLANLVFVYALFRALRSAPWRAILNNRQMVNALVGLTIGAFIFWQFNAGIRPGFNFHVLGATLFVLLFGWQVATAMISLVMVATWFRMDLDWVALGLNGLLMIAIPVLFSEWLLRFSQRNLPKNLFLFVLWNGFVCAGLAILLNVVATTLLLLALSHYSWGEIQRHYLIAAPIILLTEAFMTGMLITAFTVFQPEAVLNFNDQEYLDGK
ncbi:energy-coupling factor ABC transporter permease [Ferrigenium sp. UT5]|uniref:energy-coupling factor ABC transporter permease n=1 Tax=Ferrigenium sp. UT5 TaxID=3242105 RepID=UPI00354E8C1E